MSKLFDGSIDIFDMEAQFQYFLKVSKLDGDIPDNLAIMLKRTFYAGMSTMMVLLLSEIKKLPLCEQVNMRIKIESHMIEILEGIVKK